MKSLRNKNILITGATGFIGSNLIRFLVNDGCNNVTCLVLPDDNIDFIKKFDVNIEYGNIIEKDSLYKALDGQDVIIHLAAIVGSLDEKLNHLVNYVGTKNLIEVIEDLSLKIDRFIFASTIAASGPSEKGKLKTENDRENPISIYGKTKLLSEEYLLKKSDSIPITIFRLPLVYGPGSFGGLFFLFKIISRNIFPVLPYNETNICYVDDLSNGIVSAIINDRTIGEVFYVGENRVYNSKLILSYIKDIMNKFTFKIPFPPLLLYGIANFSEFLSKLMNNSPILSKKNLEEYLKHRFWGVSTEKAIEYFDYKTNYPIEKGLALTFNWYKKNKLIK